MGGNGAEGLNLRADLDQSVGGSAVHSECYEVRHGEQGPQRQSWDGCAELRANADILRFFVWVEASSMSSYFEVHIPWRSPKRSDCKVVDDRRFVLAGPEALRGADRLYWWSDRGDWSEEQPYWARWE